jgi:hypothetical protein
MRSDLTARHLLYGHSDGVDMGIWRSGVEGFRSRIYRGTAFVLLL